MDSELEKGVVSEEDINSTSIFRKESSVNEKDRDDYHFSKDVQLQNFETVSVNSDELVLEDISPEKSGGVLKRIFKNGEGDEYPGFGDKVSVRYKGWILNGKEKPTLFESTPEGEKCEFHLGRGMVIKSWDLGVSTMKKGEVSIFLCMPAYAYGEIGAPPKIPPYTPLLFEIELYGWKLEDLSPKRDNSISRKVLEKGIGPVFPNEGAQMKVKLIGYYDDEIFDSREVDFILGDGCQEKIPEGIEISLYRFHLKEKSYIYLKNKYALDARMIEDSDKLIKEVKYEVSLLNFTKAKEVWEMNTDEKFEKSLLAKEKGTSYFKSGNYKLALKHYKCIPICLEKEPGVSAESEESRKSLLIAGFLNIALCLTKLDNFVDAIKFCDKVLEIDPNNEKALFRRGKAKFMINDCEEALVDFEKLCINQPENFAAKNSVLMCHEKIKQQKLKDKSTYCKMFEKFKKQDEERRRNAGVETGIWQNEKREERKAYKTETQRLIERNNSALLDANIIELSNTAYDLQ